MGRGIPFYAASSTGPSHNIGVNIQQLMSTLKYRRHLRKRYSALNIKTRSATLAYNQSPFSTLVAAVKTQARYTKRRNRNPQYLEFKLSNYHVNTPVDQSLDHIANQQLDESVNELFIQQNPQSRPFHQSSNQPIGQPLNPSLYQPLIRLFNEPDNRNRPSNQQFKHPLNRKLQLLFQNVRQDSVKPSIDEDSDTKLNCTPYNSIDR